MKLDKESRQLLEESARDWLAETCPVSGFRARRDAGTPVSGNDLWGAMVELGWSGILVPEDLGGSGLGMSEMALVLEQTGRNLTPSPLLSTAVIGASALKLSQESEFAQDKLRRLVAGELHVALAVDEGYHHRPTSVACTARRVDRGWALDGRKTRVADVSANTFLVSARTEDGGSPDLFLVPADQVVVSPLYLIDSRDHGNIALEGAWVEDAARLVSGNESRSLLDLVLDRARIALAAEMLGTAWAAFDMTVEYLKVREQFGQLIGSFQALQHRVAALYVELEVCRSVQDAALLAVDGAASDEVPAMASKTKALIGEVLQQVTNETIQMHGGIGMTDEHDAGLFIKRARVAEQLYGNAAFHRDQFATLHGF